MIAYTKGIDTLYGNVSNLEFVASGDKTSTSDYKVLAKLLYKDFNNKISDGDIVMEYDSADNPVPLKSKKYTYARYLISFFAEDEGGDWGSAVDEVYEEYNPEPLPNDGTGTGLDDTAA